MGRELRRVPPNWQYPRNGDAPERNPDEMTWYQVFETVNEGAPVTPPFATQKELVEYLEANGDFEDQKRRAEGCSSLPCGTWTRKAAESFVLGGASWNPSFVVEDGRLMSGVGAIANG